MFNGNVTQTYNFQDASYEIIIMLLGAFLLGSLLTWLLHKLFSKDYTIENDGYRYDLQGDDEISMLKQSHNQKNSTTSDVKIVDKPTLSQPKTTATPDDLTKISGIDSAMEVELSNINIKSYAQLRDINTDDLKSLQHKHAVKKREIETWPHQASLAAKGEWYKLNDYQGFIQRVKNASTTSSDEVKTDSKQQLQTDDLSKIVGIDSKVEGILNNKEIYTFKQLSHIESDILKSHLTQVDKNYADHETDSWPHQAAMANKEQWEELKVYQEFMHSETDSNAIESKSDSIKNDDTVNNSDAANNSDLVKAVDNINNTDNIDNTAETNVSKLNTHTNQAQISADDATENLSDHDDLKKIEGIGPKIEELLNKGGIYTYSQLYNSNRERLRELLDNGGNQFRMHNPDSWPHQAGMANRSEWDELNTYQQSLIQDQAIKAKKLAAQQKSKNSKSKNSNISKLSAVNKKDDLKKIEGIGPKIEELLNNAGIETFNTLSSKSRDSIKELLNEAGPQFRMHEPETWPHQAKLAANGEWDQLQEYQDFLNGGRE